MKELVGLLLGITAALGGIAIGLGAFELTYLRRRMIRGQISARRTIRQ